MRSLARVIFWVGAGLAALGLQPIQAMQIPHGQDQPPNPARTPAEAVAAMTVPPGFVVDVVAAEPDLVNPVAMCFDEKGRIWVTESLEYPRRDPGPGRDRVKLLEDTDGDGAADRFAIFADGLNIPSGIAVGHGGVWVANAPDILFYPDADRDGVADGPPEVVVSGFGRHDTHELPNSLTWGPDGWLYGWNGVFNPGEVTSNNGKTYAFTCAVFRIHPRTREFQVWCEGTSNPWGITFDAEGEMFASACVIDHLWHLVESAYYIRQGGPYPPHTWPMGSIVEHTHQKAAYCGITYFDSPAFPPEYRQKLYMGNIHGNCLNVDVLHKAGSTYRGEANPDFLSANDAWFMPVSQKVGPDGSLYVLDWYDRYHCYQDANRDPAGIDRLRGRLYRVRYEGELDGPETRLVGPAPYAPGDDLGTKTPPELLQLLGHPNAYVRDTARRLLAEDASRRQEAMKAALRVAVLEMPSLKAKPPADASQPTAEDLRLRRLQGLNALWAQIGGGPLEPAFHEEVLRHPDPTVAAWGVRAAGDQGTLEPRVLTALAELAQSPDPSVRLQVAIAAAKVEGLDVVPLLVEVLSQSEGDPLIPHVVWQNLHPRLETQAEAFAEAVTRQPIEAVLALVPRALNRILASESPSVPAMATLLRVLANDPVENGPSLRATISGLTQRLLDGEIKPELGRSLRQQMAPIVNDLVDRIDPSQREPGRLLAELVLLQMAWDQEKAGGGVSLVVGGFVTGQQDLDDDQRVRALATLVARAEPAMARAAVRVALADPEHSSLALRGRLLAEMGRLDDPELGPALLEIYPKLEPELQPRVISLLAGRGAWASAMLDAVEAGALPREVLNLNQVRDLQGRGDAELTARVKRLWGSVRAGRDPAREQVVARMRELIARSPGDPVAGRLVFTKLCAQCHKIYGEGAEVGPEITLNGRNDFDQLLSNVFDPNLVIGPGYQATTVATTDGRVLTGLLAEDSEQRFVLRLQGGEEEVIPADMVEERATAEVSLMPEAMESQFNDQELADLFAFLCLDKPPEDPTARRLPGAPAPKAADSPSRDD